MNQKDDIDMARQAMLKKARSAVRAHYSTLADKRLNELLPELDRQFNQSVSRGILPSTERLLIVAGFEADE